MQVLWRGEQLHVAIRLRQQERGGVRRAYAPAQ